MLRYCLKSFPGRCAPTCSLCLALAAQHQHQQRFDLLLQQQRLRAFALCLAVDHLEQPTDRLIPVMGMDRRWQAQLRQVDPQADHLPPAFRGDLLLVLPSGGVCNRIKQGNRQLHAGYLQFAFAIEKEQKFNIGVTMPGVVPEWALIVKALAKPQDRSAAGNYIKKLLHSHSFLSLRRSYHAETDLRKRQFIFVHIFCPIVSVKQVRSML